MPRGEKRPPIGALTDLSPSRVRTADKCGLAFRYQYIDQLPAPVDRAATIFGSVLHESTHLWYGMDDHPNKELHKEQSLPELVKAQWPKWIPANIWRHTMKALEAEVRTDDVAAALMISRPELKSPRTTVAFLKSTEQQKYTEALNKLMELCDKRDDIKWPKDENPLKAYHKSLKIAEQMEARWKHMPRPLLVERPFKLDFDEFVIKGQMDQLRLDPDQQGETFVNLVDMKFGRGLMTQQEAFIQAFLYWEACLQFEDMPDPDRVSFYMGRHDKMQRGRLDYERHRKLAVQILNGVARRITMGQYEPHYGFWCSRCDFEDLCEAQISLWEPGTDGLSMEPAVATAA